MVQIGTNSAAKEISSLLIKFHTQILHRRPLSLSEDIGKQINNTATDKYKNMVYLKIVFKTDQI